MRRVSMWKRVNKCVVCGTNLKFKREKGPHVLADVGEKYCEQNHPRFSIFGSYNDKLEWILDFRFDGERA